jgi:hypothetical protein
VVLKRLADGTQEAVPVDRIADHVAGGDARA